MKRGLLAIAAGIVFLILMTGRGTIITTVVAHRTTAQSQTTRAGPYSVTLQVNPNPPSITRPALSIQGVVHFFADRKGTGAWRPRHSERSEESLARWT